MRAIVPGVQVHQLKIVHDSRGNLVAGEFEKVIGFSPKRYFMVFGVPSERVRGQHAHRRCHQYLVCVKGRLRIQVTDGRKKQTIELNKLNKGIHISPMIWCSHFNYKPGTILLVFASHHYSSADYIRNYEEFLRLKKAKRSQSFSRR